MVKRTFFASEPPKPMNPVAFKRNCALEIYVVSSQFLLSIQAEPHHKKSRVAEYLVIFRRPGCLRETL